MENGGGDALAHSQLARLYKLGLLQQDPGEVENDPHAFLNRLPPASARLAAQDERQDPRTSSFQSSGDHSSDGLKDSTDHSPFTRVRPYPLTSMMDMTRPPPRFDVASRAPLSPRSVASRPRLPPRFDATLPFYTPPVKDVCHTETWELKKQWFMTWKRCMEAKWLREKAVAVGARSLKRRVLKKWEDAVYKTHMNNARCRQMTSWRAQRTLQSWRQWAALHGRVTWFLTAQGRSHTLLNRLRRERTWVRWKRFVQLSRKTKKKTEKALHWWWRRCVRQAWLQWRVQAFCGRRRRRMYRAFMAVVRDELEARHHRWALAMDLYDSHAQDRLRRLLKRWRGFNSQRQREHQRVWHIRMIMTRGKYFTIWHATMEQTQQIQQLRCRVQRRVWTDHLRAWWVATRASKLGRTSTLWHPEAICARYLHVWKCWTHDKFRFRFATSVVHKKRLKQVLRVMRAWTEEHARFSRLRKAADAITRRRILTNVWENGLLAFHFTRKHEQRLVLEVRSMSLAKAMQRWRFEWFVRHEWRSKKQQARKLAFQGAVKGVWNGWRRYTEGRRQHKQQISRATQCDYHRLISRGLMSLAKAVDRKSELTRACRQIRVRRRETWKRRVMLAWRGYTKKVRLLEDRLALFIARPVYARSIWNPLRRRWRRWVAFTHRQTQSRLSLRRIQQHWQRGVFEAWKRRVFVVAAQRRLTNRHARQILLASMMAWKVFVDSAAEKGGQRVVASSFYRHKCCLKVLREWSRLAVLQRQVRERGDNFRAIQCQRNRLLWFSLWRRNFMLKRGIRALERRRRHAWFQFCWDAWWLDHHAATKLKKKLTYYHRVFGAYPSTSPLNRLWCRWKEWTRRRHATKQFQYQVELRQAAVCLAAWKTFHLTKRILRQWHRFSVIAGATHSDLGKRCRLLREKRHQKLLQTAFRAWRSASKARQRRYEAFLDAKQRTLDEIPRGYALRVKHRRCQLRQWFQRWRRRQLESVHLAMHLHRMKTLRTVFIRWWRQVVHGKQERLLEGARRTMGSLSINKTRQMTGDKNCSGSKRVAFGDERNVAAARGRMVDALPVRSSYSQPSHRLPPKQTLTAQASRIQRAEITRRAQESVEKYRGAATTSSLTQSQSQPSDKRPAPRVSTPLKELPLFHEELQRTTRSPPPCLVIAESEAAFTLESIASMDPYSPPSEPKKIAGSRAHSIPKELNPPRGVLTSSHLQGATRASRTVESSLFVPSQSLAPHPLASAKKEEKPSAHRKRPNKSPTDLVQLLEIPEQEIQRPASTFRSVLHGLRTDNQPSEPLELDVQRIVRRIVDYYVAKSQQIAAVGHEWPLMWLQTWGFCLLRDLGLFENGHFMSAMERAIERVTAGSVDHEPRVALQLLLEEFIQGHPHRKASSRQEDPLVSLIKRHLMRRCGQAALQQANTTAVRPFWIRYELPSDVVVSLPKLTKCFIKYQKPLEQFFLWRPEHSGVLSSKTDCRMALATFILLMKHANVHPQLFDRRELEEAVACAGVSTSRGQETGMNLPQFIEALVRCALRLQWMDESSHEGSNAARFPELVVTIKFLMLVFTMEGRGSMLTKRSQDLDVLMGFLQKQQHETSAEKLRRFQGLLRAEPPRAHEEPRKKRHAVQGNNVFRSFMGSRTEAYEAQAASVYPPTFPGRERTPTEANREANQHQSLDESQGRRFHGDGYERSGFRAGSEREQADERSIPRGAEAGYTASRPYSDASSERGDRRESHRGELLQLSRQLRVHQHSQVDQSHKELQPQPAAQSTSRPDEQSTPPSSSFGNSQVMQTASSPSVEMASEFPVASLSGLQPPMDREAFLNEILSSITDVELLLQQADERRGSTLPTNSSYPLVDTAPDTLVELSSEPFSIAYPERHALLTTGRLPTSPLNRDDIDTTNLAEDVRVGDPVLDYLTFADRFSESQNWKSHLTIADVAEHGIHAAFPSSMHVLEQIHTGELDDLTHPQPATAHLRASDNDDYTSRSQFLSWSSEREWLNALHDSGDDVSR